MTQSETPAIDKLSVAIDKATHASDLSPDGVQVIYSSQPHWPGETSKCIHVLDSSFNPPTIAHLALATAQGSPDQPPDAHLLLLSVRNVDKTLKPGDATHEQRLQMMVMLAKTLEEQLSSATRNLPNVAVAVIDEKLFVSKSSRLRAFLTAHLNHTTSPTPNPPSPNPSNQIPRLVFLLGFDTIVRLFNPAYYESIFAMHSSLDGFFADPPEGQGSRVLCARRPNSVSDATDEEKFLSSPDVAKYATSGAIQIISLGVEESLVSSTAVRNGVAQGEGNWEVLCTPTIVQYIREGGLYISN